MTNVFNTLATEAAKLAGKTKEVKPSKDVLRLFNQELDLRKLREIKETLVALGLTVRFSSNYFGSVVEELHTICSAVEYATVEQKEIVPEGVKEVFTSVYAKELLGSFGSLPYFDKNIGEHIEGVTPDTQRLNIAFEGLRLLLDLKGDYGLLTGSKYTYALKRAEVKARGVEKQHNLKEEILKTLSEDDELLAMMEKEEDL